MQNETTMGSSDEVVQKAADLKQLNASAASDTDELKSH